MLAICRPTWNKSECSSSRIFDDHETERKVILCQINFAGYISRTLLYISIIGASQGCYYTQVISIFNDPNSKVDSVPQLDTP